ncbi:MotA/TolQ/ExbB proton channel family protein [Neisseria sp. ZJ106]|uniref:Biopolymer transport protein ExbB n=1 Tax=Neisseria lisongii TaxID=2912188 RepID=A0AAW5AK72_9NEIS|nr:MotA/TolQ/ExbB proton channel family protein [Neisseria lisongii]MCF7520465.1 MotA/TolQ/ExbB proton channel family protein [Neisseria lisongii]MCF7530302.1 MotA/TolQ/ExbB proton channel family protein [Neisseria lisongii]WCL71593.1 MotA/TolQ/ExbB proton channel family protein [Neisseria lisongii]
MNLGMVFETGDFVLISVFLLMLLMSVVTWSVIIIRLVSYSKAKAGNAAAKKIVMDAFTLNEAAQKVGSINAPIALLTKESVSAFQSYRQGGKGTLATALPLNEYLVGSIHNSMSQIMRRFDGGMTALASIGATAPFIGLFGTVWGIYHALINISQSGQMSIAAVAGPIGEALIATAIGLFVAIPAVLAYNFLSRSKKTLTQDLDAFAHDLHVRLLNQKD